MLGVIDSSIIMDSLKNFFIDILQWIGSSAFRLFSVIVLLVLFAIGWFFYTEKDAIMTSYRAAQALPKMNGQYETASNFIMKNSSVELIAIFEVNTLLNTRELVWFVTRESGRNKNYDGLEVGLLTKNHANNRDVIDLMSGQIPCHPYKLPQSRIGFVYKEAGINYMCRISVPSDPGTFIGQITVGWKEESLTEDQIELSKTLLIIASGILYRGGK